MITTRGNFLFTSSKAINKEKFYSGYIFETNINSIISLVKEFTNDAFVVNKPLQFNSLQFGSTTKEVNAILGKERFTFKNTYGSLTHTVLTYKHKFGDYLGIVNCNFLNNRLFYVHVCFPNYKESVLNFVKSEIEATFNCTLPQHKVDITLTNSNKEKLQIESDINLNIYYIANDAEVHQLLDNELQNMATKKSDAKIRRSFFSIW